MQKIVCEQYIYGAKKTAECGPSLFMKACEYLDFWMCVVAGKELCIYLPQ